MEGNRMAGTAGSGGLGALAIGGIAAAVVVIGGVVLVQFGVFNSEPPVVDPVETAEQAAPETGTPNVIAVTEPANTNAQAGDDDQAATAAPTEDSQVEAAETAAIVVPETAAPDTVTEEVAQADTTEQIDATVDAAAEALETAENAETDGITEPDVSAEDQVVETTEQNEAPEEVAEVSVEETAQPVVTAETDTAVESQAPVTETADASVAISESAEQIVSEEKSEEIETAALVQPEATIPERAEEATFVLTAPELDLVRFDADGAGLIAGRAQAGVEVSVLLDGRVLDRFEVQNGGEFVSFSSIDPSTEARVVSLLAAFNGQRMMSDATFILAPSAAVDAVTTESEQPQVVDVVPAEVTPDAQNDSGTVDDIAMATTPEAVAQDEAPSESEPAEVAEATSVSEEPVEEVAVEATNQPTEVGPVEDKPAEAVETAAVIPQPVVQPVAETAPQPEPSPVAMVILKADAEGVEIIQPATPVAPELLGKVSLDIISYSDEGDVQLAGRAGPDSLVRVYLDNSPVADIQAAGDGSWKGQLSDIDPGIYTLRLDELDAGGKVLSRLETPFKRESPEALQPPAAPEDSPAQVTPAIRAVTVQKGDTLWAISRERYGDGLLYVRVFEANQEAIRDPDLIYPGQIFSIPE
jgi:hypothetical protein